MKPISNPEIKSKNILTPGALLLSGIPFLLLTFGACNMFSLKPQVYSNTQETDVVVKKTNKKTKKKTKKKTLKNVVEKTEPVKGKNIAGVSVLKQKGYRFWLRNKPDKIVKKGFIRSKVRYDELHLKPGAYMIGFIRTTPRVGGAAYCRLEGGKTYSFKVVSRQYLPKTGTYAFLGKCFFDPERKDNMDKK